ncbi:MAG: hypothetical protein ACLFVQ_09440 [Chitinispirillaceae bacterium]
MANFVNYIKEHGFTLMLIGMFLAIASIIAYISVQSPRYAGTIYPQITMGGAVTGFVIYFIGRILVMLQRRKGPPKRNDRS